LLLLLFCSSGVWTQSLTVARQVLWLLVPLQQPIFELGIFEIRSQEPFAWAGIKPPSSWSLPPD
jgi:hypothetical protein